MSDESLPREAIEAMAREVAGQVLTRVGRALAHAGSKAEYDCDGASFDCGTYTCHVPDMCAYDFECRIDYTPGSYDKDGQDCRRKHHCKGEFVCEPGDYDCMVNFECDDFTG